MSNKSNSLLSRRDVLTCLLSLFLRKSGMNSALRTRTRELLDNFAKKAGILRHKDWYKIKLHEVFKDKQLKSLLEQNYSGNRFFDH